MVYCCNPVSWSTSVDKTTRFFPSLEVLKSTMDSSEVAQYFSSPLILVSSHSLRVFFTTLASSDSGLMENLVKTSSTLLDEKGIESATWRGKKVAWLELGVKCRSIFVP
ncbi:hypothetical protein V8G54_007529 [Vigna mungo]|uniref:Uncharacterized protein n=1 Tax=Vigna mungo TaxID=3915 RepID=A0AAQ3S7E1_VIGMU